MDFIKFHEQSSANKKGSLLALRCLRGNRCTKLSIGWLPTTPAGLDSESTHRKEINKKLSLDIQSYLRRFGVLGKVLGFQTSSQEVALDVQGKTLLVCKR